MDLIVLLVVVVLVGFLTYMLTTKVPMPPYWATTIQIAVLILVIIVIFTRYIKLPNFLS